MIELNRNLSPNRLQWYQDKINRYLARWGHDKNIDFLIDHLECWFGVKIIPAGISKEGEDTE